ncbi:MAG: hypothetical protein ACXQT4_02825, partial [Methanotrichaceae archaeon]
MFREELEEDHVTKEFLAISSAILMAALVLLSPAIGYTLDAGTPYNYTNDAGTPYNYTNDAGTPYNYTNDAGTPYNYTNKVLKPCECEAAAPDFSICQYTELDDTIFTDAGASCSEGCDISLDYSGV